MAAHTGKPAVIGPSCVIKAEVSLDLRERIDAEPGPDRATKIRELIEVGLRVRSHYREVSSRPGYYAVNR